MEHPRAAETPCEDLALAVEPNSREVARVRRVIAATARACRLTDDETGDFVTAVNEALANAIEHSQSASAISVTCRVRDNALVATIVDRGVGFAPPATSSAPPPVSERGRGLSIMRRCTDIFHIESRPGCGTSIVLGRFLPDPSIDRSRRTA